MTRALKGEGMDEPPPVLEESVKELNADLQRENKNLHAQNLSLHEKQHLMGLKAAELEEKVQALETEHAEMQNRLEDMEYDLNKTRNHCEKVESHLTETCQKLKALQDEGITAPAKNANGGAASTPATTKLSTNMTAKKVK